MEFFVFDISFFLCILLNCYGSIKYRFNVFIIFGGVREFLRLLVFNCLWVYVENFGKFFFINFYENNLLLNIRFDMKMLEKGIFGYFYVGFLWM